MSVATLTPIPDVIAGLIAHAQESAAVDAIANGRISGRVRSKSKDDPSGWPMPGRAIVFQRAGGLPPLQTIHMQRARVQARCYGKSLFDAATVWRTLHAYLSPVDDVGNCWVAANCRVWTVEQEAGEIAMVEQGTAYPVVICSYIVHYSEVPAP